MFLIIAVAPCPLDCSGYIALFFKALFCRLLLTLCLCSVFISRLGVKNSTRLKEVWPHVQLMLLLVNLRPAFLI